MMKHGGIEEGEIKFGKESNNGKNANTAFNRHVNIGI